MPRLPKMSICGRYRDFESFLGLQLPLQQWGAGNVYLLVLSSWKVDIAENPIVVVGL